MKVSYLCQIINLHTGLASCNDAVCTSPSIKTVDSVGEVGESTSIALNSSGFPIISYYDATNDALKVAVCNNATCTQPTINIVDTDGDVGYYSSIALTTDDFPIISYYDSTYKDTKIAVCHNIACTNPTLSRIDSLGNVGEYTSLALDNSGYPVISYYAGGDLRLAVFEVATAVPSGNKVYSPFIVR